MRLTASSSTATILALATVFALGLSPAAADPLPGQERESRVLSDRLNVTLGGYRPEFSTDVAAGFGGVLGAFIDVERTLGLQEDLSVYRLDGFYRFKPRHGIDWTYTVLNRDGITSIDEEIQFEDRVFALGAEVESTFDSTLFAVNYKYSFVNNGKIEAGISAGLFIYEYDLALKGDASILEDDGTVSGTTEFQQVETRVLAPLPAVGMFINYAVRHNLIFRGDVRFLNIEIGDFAGKFTDTRFTLDWYFGKHFGLGIGTARTSIDFKSEGSDPFRINYGYGGFLYYVSITF